jgi:hypothetical protein
LATYIATCDTRYCAVAYIEATATIFQDDKLLVEVDHLKNISTPYIQIKGSNKEAVAAAGLALNLEGSYTTMPYIEIILDNGGESNGVEDPQAARLQELVDYVQAQVSVFLCSATIVICATFMFVALWIYYFPTNCILVQTA